MSYPASNIIPIVSRIRAAGLGLANFSSAMLFAKASELPVSFTVDTYRSYSSMKGLAEDFADTTETYKSAEKFLDGVPTTRKILVWATNSTDATVAATLIKARNKTWWFYSMFTPDVLAVEASVLSIAAWAESNESFFVNNQTGVSAAKIRDLDDDTDIASKLTLLGYRFTATFAHASDGNAGSALMKHFAAVNYSAANSTIDGDFKKSPSVLAESLDGSEYEAMEKKSKRAVFYTVVDTQGSQDIGRWKNTNTHSAYGETIDDVINLAAITNAIRVRLYNTVANQLTKLGQDPVGQAILIGAAKVVGTQYIANGYLGPRNYTNPDDGQMTYTSGFEVLTAPEEILDLSDEDRDAHKSAPLRIRIFRKGSIRIVDVTLDVY